MRFVLLSLFISTIALAQADQFKDFEAIGHHISTEAIKLHEASGGKTPIDGAYLEALVPQKDIYDCDTAPEEDDGSETRYEVLLVARGNTQQEKSSPEVPLLQRPAAAYIMGLNSIIFANKRKSLSEDALATALADAFKKDTSFEEQITALKGMSDNMYARAYNDPRNPGMNNKHNNPNNEVLPDGDLTLNQMLDAAYNLNKYMRPVCNDIAEGVAMVAEKMLPGHDVLVINQGTHHVVAITDGKTTRIIGDERDHFINHLAISPTYGATNMRVSKMEGGTLKEIAVVDSQTGQLLEQAFKTGRPLLKTGVDISSIVADFKMINENNSGRTHSLDSAVAVGDVNEARMFVVVAKYEYKTRNGRTYVGLGGSANQQIQSGTMRYQLHLRYGSEVNVINYASPKLDLKLTGGLGLEVMAGTRASGDALNKTDVSLDISPFGRASAVIRPTDKITVKSDVEVRSSVGPDNWGEITGRFSRGTISGIKGVVENTDFHLNQVYATTGLEAKLSPRSVASANVKYQGSNVGQAVDVNTGLHITTNSGAKIMVFTGLSTTKIAGYQTKHSLLNGNNGAYVGAGYETPEGVVFSGSLTNIAPKQAPAFQLNVEAPLTPKKPKK